MDNLISGIHHVTAIASDAQRNVDFYTGVVGLRLVKVTVNYDDPTSYHLYYGDESGAPGSILTFFAWSDGRSGQHGVTQAGAIAFAVPKGSMAYWKERLSSNGVSWQDMPERFGTEPISFLDPDGLVLELVEVDAVSDDGWWHGGPVPEVAAVRGLHGITLLERKASPTAHLLVETMGLQLLDQNGDRSRYLAGSAGRARTVDIVSAPSDSIGQMGVGCVHHVAWRTPDDPSQAAWQTELKRIGIHVSEIMDRQYFHSIYFREPGGILFEIATDSPGFSADEFVETLGSKLRLPSWMEPDRREIELLLPPFPIVKVTEVEDVK